MARTVDRELTERQRRIVRAVVAQHIRTAQPVGSKTICETHGLPCSPATIRNEMVRLEEKGYLHQPHTSAGRAPLEPAYRLYVNGLLRSRMRLDRQMTWMQGEIRRLAAEPEAALQRTSGLLSHTTKYPAVVTRPQETSARLAELSLAPISAHNVRLSYVDDQGNAEETLIETQTAVKVSDVRALERALRRALLGRPLTPPPELDQAPAADAAMLSAIQAALEESVSGHVYVEGTAYMLDQPEFAQIDTLRRVMKTLGHSPLLRRLLHATAGPGRVSVTIGNEHGVEPLSDCSVVAASYSLPRRSHVAGTVGVVGPMRMNYRLAMAAVACVARELGAALARQQGG